MPLDAHFLTTTISPAGFPKKDARLLKYFKFIFSLKLPSLSSLGSSELYFNYERRASFTGNPLSIYISRKHF